MLIKKFAFIKNFSKAVSVQNLPKLESRENDKENQVLIKEVF